VFVGSADGGDIHLEGDDEGEDHLKKTITTAVHTKRAQLTMAPPALLLSKFVNLGDPNSWKSAPIAASSAWL